MLLVYVFVLQSAPQNISNDLFFRVKVWYAAFEWGPVLFQQSETWTFRLSGRDRAQDDDITRRGHDINGRQTDARHRQQLWTASGALQKDHPCELNMAQSLQFHLVFNTTVRKKTKQHVSIEHFELCVGNYCPKTRTCCILVYIISPSRISRTFFVITCGQNADITGNFLKTWAENWLLCHWVSPST